MKLTELQLLKLQNYDLQLAVTQMKLNEIYIRTNQLRKEQIDYVKSICKELNIDYEKYIINLQTGDFIPKQEEKKE